MACSLYSAAYLAWITFEFLEDNHVFKKKGYKLVAPFVNLRGLKAGDEVLMAGVKIGLIDKTRFRKQGVEAVLKIDPKVKIPDDSVTRIEADNLLGLQHLAITLGKSPMMLKEGDKIGTKRSIDLNEVISQLGSLGEKLSNVADNISQTFGSREASSLLTKFDKSVTENKPKLIESISNFRNIIAKIKNGDGTIGKLVNDPSLHSQLLAAVSEIKSAASNAKTFINNTNDIVAKVKSKGALGMLLFDQATADNLKATIANIREMSDKIASGQGTLGKLLNDDKPYKDVQPTLRKANQALDSI